MTPALLEALVVHEAVHPQLSPADVAYLQKFGVLRDDVKLVDHHLHTADGLAIEADLADLIGPAPAHQLASLGRAAASALRSRAPASGATGR